MRRQRLFLDTSVWIAAAASLEGASALVLAFCRHRHARAVASHPVLLEAERNIREKLGEDALLRFYREVAGAGVELVQAATPEEIAAQARIIPPKDAHVLAAALKGNITALLTLDRKHFLIPSVLHADLPFQIMTPRDFLRRR